MRPALFTDVAMLLVNGNDPKRLAVALASYSRLIGTRRPNEDDDRDDDALLLAARVLEEKLPHYVQDHLGLPTPDYIDTILIHLPELIEFLQAQRQKPRKLRLLWLLRPQNPPTRTLSLRLQGPQAGGGFRVWRFEVESGGYGPHIFFSFSYKTKKKNKAPYLPYPPHPPFFKEEE